MPTNASRERDADPAYASVAIPVPVRRLFSYRVAPALAAAIAPGARVRVPFGPRKLNATVVEWPAAGPGEGVEIREIDSVLRDGPELSAELLELTRFVADYYLCSWGEAIEAALPPWPGKRRATVLFRRLGPADPAALPAGATAMRRVLEALPADGGLVPRQGIDPAVRRAIPALLRRGWIESVESGGAGARAPAGDAAGSEAERPPTPTPGQADVLERIRPALGSREYRPFVLFGATGSGKTEVYLRAADRVLEQGRGVLYLVPEIGLTPLLLSKISRRFPGRAAVLHSGLPRARRYEAWTRVRSGACRFVIGTRSAVFAPLADIGLIVVDEEQDGSYKQQESPRYNGRDLAVVRARAGGSVLLLGSATPSMESFQHALSGRYGLLRLGGRIHQRPLPEVTLVDMRREFQRRGKITPVSAKLLHELRACLDRGDQALVLRNRRGWAAAVLCPRCGERITCSSCSIAMTWHRSAERLRCHYCAEQQRYPRSCPTCGCEELRLVGEGTERLEHLMHKALPGARIERMDRDTVRRRGAHEAMLRRFEGGEIDVLVGTQMIAKGHDFPRVTLVGVLSADHSLGLPDFRAGERSFQLLTQMAGRSGRGVRAGSVVVQAFDIEHPVLRLAAAQDYEAFFEREIRYRRALRYPPLSAMVQLLIQDRDELRAREWAQALADALLTESRGRLLLSGPGPAPLERVRGRHRQQILARTAGRRRLVEAVDRALTSLEDTIPRRAILVDVDPSSLF